MYVREATIRIMSLPALKEPLLPLQSVRTIKSNRVKPNRIEHIESEKRLIFLGQASRGSKVLDQEYNEVIVPQEPQISPAFIIVLEPQSVQKVSKSSRVFFNLHDLVRFNVHKNSWNKTNGQFQLICSLCFTWWKRRCFIHQTPVNYQPVRCFR